MRGIVWYKDKEIGESKLKEIKERYETLHIGVISMNKYMLKCDNGDSWLLQKATERHASRCNIAYIQKGVSQDYIEQVIIPTTNLSPYNAFNYYN